ncbi:MAG TPA: helix-hairpin-helix domain-containing protein [bacterium]
MKHLATAALLLTLVVAAPAGAAAPSGAPPPAPQTAGDTRARVEVNRASLAELIGVPGIGERLAQAIIDLREKKGPFTKLDDLLEVRGIGEKNLALFAEHLMVAPPAAGVPAKVSAAK